MITIINNNDKHCRESLNRRHLTDFSALIIKCVAISHTNYKTWAVETLLLWMSWNNTKWFSSVHNFVIDFLHFYRFDCHQRCWNFCYQWMHFYNEIFYSFTFYQQLSYFYTFIGLQGQHTCNSPDIFCCISHNIDCKTWIQAWIVSWYIVDFQEPIFK